MSFFDKKVSPDDKENEGVPGNRLTALPQEVQLSDLLPILEIDSRTKKMIHPPSLNIFMMKTVSEHADRDKQRLYTALNSWKRLAQGHPEQFVRFDNVFYFFDQNLLQICLNHTNLYPLKVTSTDTDRSATDLRPPETEVCRQCHARPIEDGSAFERREPFNGP